MFDYENIETSRKQWARFGMLSHYDLRLQYNRVHPEHQISVHDWCFLLTILRQSIHPEYLRTLTTAVLEVQQLPQLLLDNNIVFPNIPNIYNNIDIVTSLETCIECLWFYTRDPDYGLTPGGPFIRRRSGILLYYTFREIVRIEMQYIIDNIPNFTREDYDSVLPIISSGIREHIVNLMHQVIPSDPLIPSTRQLERILEIQERWYQLSQLNTDIYSDYTLPLLVSLLVPDDKLISLPIKHWKFFIESLSSLSPVITQCAMKATEILYGDYANEEFIQSVMERNPIGVMDNSDGILLNLQDLSISVQVPNSRDIIVTQRADVTKIISGDLLAVMVSIVIRMI